jgi:hypothetical protein
MDHLTSLLYLFSQDPQCEGYHRDRNLFTTLVIERDYFPVHQKSGGYLLNAGAVHGISEGEQFTLYENEMSSTELGTLLVSHLNSVSSRMSVPTGAPQISLCKGAVARRSKASDTVDLRLHVPKDDIPFSTVLETISRLQEYSDAKYAKILPVEKDKATLVIALEDNHFVFYVQDHRVTDHGLKRIPHPFEVTFDKVRRVLSGTARYYRYLNRTKCLSQFFQNIDIEFYKLKDTDDFDNYFQQVCLPDSPNLLHKDPVDDIYGIINLAADTGYKYGMKITNNTRLSLYTSIFIFENSDFSIGERLIANEKIHIDISIGSVLPSTGRCRAIQIGSVHQ